MSARRLLLAVALAAFLAGCDQDGDGYDDQTGEPVPTVGAVDGLGIATPGTRWVVEGSAGPRGPDNDVLICVPAWAYGHEPTEPGYGLWKEVPAADADMPGDGQPCLPGGTIYDDGPIRTDGAS